MKMSICPVCTLIGSLIRMKALSPLFAFYEVGLIRGVADHEGKLAKS
jgi:hypothetical protein